MFTATRENECGTFTHSFDVAPLAERLFAAPRCAEVYNIGGGRGNLCSILEAFERVEELPRRPMKWAYVNTPSDGDHICYITI
jgi:CDP-paratose 2-epimerase